MLHLAAQPMVRLSLREPALTLRGQRARYGQRPRGGPPRRRVRSGGRGRDLGQVLREPVRLCRCFFFYFIAPPLPPPRRHRRRHGHCRHGSRPSIAPGEADPADGVHRFVETDPLGGHDPYSSSKACAELVTAAYRDSFFSGGRFRALATAPRGQRDRRGRLRRRPTRRRTSCALYDAGRPVRCAIRRRSARGSTCSTRSAAICALAQALCGPGRGEAAAVRSTSVRRPRTRAPVLEIVQRLDGLLEGALGYEVDGGRASTRGRAAGARLRRRPNGSWAGARAGTSTRRSRGWQPGTRRTVAARTCGTVSLSQIAACSLSVRIRLARHLHG